MISNLKKIAIGFINMGANIVFVKGNSQGKQSLAKIININTITTSVRMNLRLALDVKNRFNNPINIVAIRQVIRMDEVEKYIILPTDFLLLFFFFL